MAEALTVGSLFSGIGGIDLGLERAGMRVLWQSEINPFASRVLAKHWPGVPNHGDITQIDFRQVEPVDVLAGGFPCQDISKAGKGAGLDGERSGLWREYARAISEIRPHYVFVENVSVLLGRGLGGVLGDLAALGYDAEWDCIPASAVGAPHLRDRLYLVAYPVRGGRESGRLLRVGGAVGTRRDAAADTPATPNAGTHSLAADANGERREELYPAAEPARPKFRDWLADPVRNYWWAPEPDVGRVVDGVPNGVDRLRGLGNAVVPQIPEMIGGWIINHARATGYLDCAT